jgi:hypothetical protein
MKEQNICNESTWGNLSASVARKEQRGEKDLPSSSLPLEIPT